MGRRKRTGERGPSGVVVIDKPVGPTSFSVLRSVQRRLGSHKAGHAGTLDPAASGVLVGLLGEATKLSDWVMADAKAYRATVRLGAQTDTLDAEGEVVARSSVPDDALSQGALQRALAGLTGTYQQVPPRFSAIKRDGRSLMSRARAGEDFVPQARTVTCHALTVVSKNADVGDDQAEVVLDVDCAKGFYVRSLARDLGSALGTHGYLTALRRTRSGLFRIDAAKVPDALSTADILPLTEAVGGEVAQVVVTPDRVAKVRNGQPAPRDGDETRQRALLISPAGDVLALAIASADGAAWRVARGIVPAPGQTR